MMSNSGLRSAVLRCHSPLARRSDETSAATQPSKIDTPGGASWLTRCQPVPRRSALPDGLAALVIGLGASRALAAAPTGEVLSETAGPFPGDGSNGPNVLDDAGI